MLDDLLRKAAEIEKMHQPNRIQQAQARKRKRCPRCKRWLRYSQFEKSFWYRDGLHVHCNYCRGLERQQLLDN